MQVSDTTISERVGAGLLSSPHLLNGFHNLTVIEAAVADGEGRARFVVSEEEILEWAALESTPVCRRSVCESRLSTSVAPLIFVPRSW
jgi:hypothetical protein